ncbi:MAG: von Willebrand factor type A domain-containing protein, partial [Sedimentisphaerales bacterium]|nr:von Willebrand factor type A domain-containing protein [Sedimentisphaerales bacterium]
MNREQAEKLLTALIFDDLDETSKTDLLSYLESDEELRERLSDMRMAAKVACDALVDGPDPVLDERRLKRLGRLAERGGTGARIFTMRRLAAAAAVVAAVVLPASILLPSLNRVRMYSLSVDSSVGTGLRHGAETETTALYDWDVERPADGLETSGGGALRGQRYASDAGSRGGRDAYYLPPPDVPGASISPDGDGLIMAEAGGLGGRSISVPSGEASRRAAGAGAPGYDYYSGAAPGAAPSSATAPRQAGVVASQVRAGESGAMGDKTEESLSITDGAYKLGKDVTVGVGVAGGADFGTTIVNSDFAGAVVTDGRNVTFNDGHFDLELKPEASVPVTGSGAYLPLEPAGGASGAPDVLAMWRYNKVGVEKSEKVPAKKMDDDADALPGISRRRGTISMDYEDLDAFVGFDAGAEGDKLDRKKAQPLDSGYGTIKEHYREGEVSKEDAQEIDKAADKNDTVSMKYDESPVPPPAVEVKLPGIRRPADEARAREIRGGDFDYKSVWGDAVKQETSSGVPILGDVPLLGVLYDRKAGDVALTESEAQQEGKSPADRELAPEAKAKSIAAGGRSESRIAGPMPGQSGAEYRDHAVVPEVPKEMLKSYRMLARGEEAGQRGGGVPAVDLDGIRSEDLDWAGKRPAPADTSPEEPMIVKQTETASTLAPGKPLSQFELGGPANGPSSVDRIAVAGGEDLGDLPEAARFKVVPVNPWVMTERDSLSTFGLDVDTASYSVCRRYIRGGFHPPAGAVRMEEFINYFNYRYPQRANPVFAVHAEAGRSPFAGEGKDLTLLKIGVKARTMGRDQRRAAHLVFVVDASASMDQPDRLSLVQQALKMLVGRLSAVDRVTLITCASDARLHLEATSARERDKIIAAIDAIQPGGATNLLAGLKVGYASARRAFAPKQINQVVLGSDGVANVGQTEADAVLNEVAADRKQGITITCVGVGYGSYNDAFLESLANRGDGSYVFLDSVGQAERVFVEQLAATLETVARDARIQVAFNPNRVRRYRLIGYENRDIEDKRFRDDTVDAGEV